MIFIFSQKYNTPFSLFRIFCNLVPTESKQCSKVITMTADQNAAGSLSQSLRKRIYRNLHHRACILVLGPGLATTDTDENLLQGFAVKLAAELDDEGIEYDESHRHDLPYIGTRWLRGVPNVQESDLRYEFKDFCADRLDEIPRVYSELAQLPFFLVVNTAPDDYMHRAFEAAGKKSQLLFYNYLRNQTPLIPEMNEQNPLVYNLFGYYTKPESLVITKEDQMQFINNLLQSHSTLPNEMMRHFDNEKTYLFLGFDVQTWHLPLLFRSLGLRENNASSFYLNEPSTENRRLRHFYSDSFKFKFIDEDPLAFAKTLRRGYTEWAAGESQAQPTETDRMGYIAKPQPGADGKVKLLVMTASPKDAQALELNREFNALEDAHLRAELRSQFSLRPVLDVQKKKMLDILLKQKPQIIHFSGHGSGSQGLLFYGDNGHSDLVRGEDLALLFRQFNDIISCVVLNACYSEVQAKAIAQFIPNVIGTDSAIGDETAIVFAESFYNALFAGETYEKAYLMAMAQVGLHRFQGGKPVFYKEGKLMVNG